MVKLAGCFGLPTAEGVVDKGAERQRTLAGRRRGEEPGSFASVAKKSKTPLIMILDVSEFETIWTPSDTFPQRRPPMKALFIATISHLCPLETLPPH